MSREMRGENVVDSDGSEASFKIHKKRDTTALRGTISSENNAWYKNDYDERDESEGILCDEEEEEEEEDEDEEDDEDDEDDEDGRGIPPEVYADIPELSQPMPMPPFFINKRARIDAESSKILRSSSSSSSSSSYSSGGNSTLLLSHLLTPGQIKALIASCPSNQLNELLHFAKQLVDEIEVEKTKRNGVRGEN